MRKDQKLYALAACVFLTAVFAGCADNRKPETADPLDLSGIDSSVRPQDNFFLYANGNWIRKTEIPPSQSSWGSGAMLYELTLSQMHSILDSVSNLHAASGSIEQKVGDLYASAMDSAAIEKAGMTPLRADLDRINMIKNPDDIQQEIATEYAIGHGPAFSFYANADDKNSAMVVAHFDQGGLGLPSRDYYFKEDSSIKNIRLAYEKYIAQMLVLEGDKTEDAAKNAAGVLALEKNLAGVSKAPVELRDPNANYHKMAVAELAKKTPGINWKSLLDRLQVQQDTVLVGQPEFYTGLAKLFDASHLSAWKNYFRFHLADDYAPYLSSNVVNTRFEFNRLLNGQRKIKERWKRMSGMVDEQLGDGLGQLYVQRYFPPEAKTRILELVNNLISTYGERIKGLDWMSDSTKQKALVKLNAIVKKIGYPDKWKDYSSVHISRDSLVANLQQTSHFEYLRNIHKIGKPVDKSEWYMTPPTVDAYYNPLANDINFPAGILQPPFFFKDGDDAVNYGAIGLVIGHEITHGFDDQGRQYDAEGNLKEWWTKTDEEKFKKKADLVVAEYNGYVAIDTFHINGELTLGENIADIGGEAIAFAAFKKTEQGKGTEKISGLTPEQRFFMSLAQVWRNKTRDEVLRTQVMNNPHSTPMYRVLGPASNTPGFYEAFGLKPGDKMYRDDSIRVHIW